MGQGLKERKAHHNDDIVHAASKQKRKNGCGKSFFVYSFPKHLFRMECCCNKGPFYPVFFFFLVVDIVAERVLFCCMQRIGAVSGFCVSSLFFVCSFLQMRSCRFIVTETEPVVPMRVTVLFFFSSSSFITLLSH